MDASQRHGYLQAMGIDVYTHKAVTPSIESVEVEKSRPISKKSKETIKENAAIRHKDWSALNAQVTQCRQCSLADTRTQTVFGVGNLQAKWLIIGEAPGADEDRQGEPFVGRAGQLLNEVLWAAGYPREQVYIANILKCRPPNNRDPQPEEVSACKTYLDQQIGFLKPEIILCVGRIAAQNLLQVDTPIGKLRGRVHSFEINSQKIPVVVTYHPAYLLRSPREKRKVWLDMQLALMVEKGLYP